MAPGAFPVGFGLAGLAIGAIFAIGTLIYQEFRNKRNLEYGHHYRANRRSSPEQKRKIYCYKCFSPLTQEDTLAKLKCNHIFHKDCVALARNCPYPNCGKLIADGRTKANCSRCSSPLAQQEIVKLPCDHIFHHNCIAGARRCPFPNCGKLIVDRSAASSPRPSEPEVVYDCCDKQTSYPPCRLSCHTIHWECLKMGCCPMPSCLYRSVLEASE